LSREGETKEGTKGDAVCFTAGSEVAAFGAGTIHAYLAMDRPPPVIVAGISSGAIAAAAMRQCYVDREHARSEAFISNHNGANGPPANGSARNQDESMRWRWFRRYLETLSDHPFQVIWDGLPNASDFFADHPPITDPATPPALKEHEFTALDQRYRLVQLGRWLIRLRLRVKDVALLAVTYVRRNERYVTPFAFRWAAYQLALVRLFLSTLSHLVLSPNWHRPASFAREQFLKKSESRWKTGFRLARKYFPLLGFRPLFGFRIWLVACSAGVALCLLFVAASCAFAALVARASGPSWLVEAAPLAAKWLVLGAVPPLLHVGIEGLRRRSAWRQLFDEIGLKQSLIDDFHLRQKLTGLFGSQRIPKPKNLHDRPHPVIVAAPLQTLKAKTSVRAAQQLYGAPDASIVESLLTATSLPGLFEPTCVKRTVGEGDAADAGKTQYPGWILPGSSENVEVQLIDGAAIRQNPLPAFFRYLRDHEKLAEQLDDGPNPSIHVVYSVPIEPVRRKGRGAKEGEVRDRDANIVDVGLTALRLARRCDTQLEVMQANFLTDLGRIQKERGATGSGRRLYFLKADEIAPDPSAPSLADERWSPDAVRRAVASGCKRTLQVIYEKALKEAIRRNPQEGPDPWVDCKRFAEEQRGAGNVPDRQRPGLPEICARCDGKLRVNPASQEQARRYDEEVQGQHVEVEKFPHLLRSEPRQPRIVLVASGGVFRGAFHVGMAGAMWIVNARPDLIVGASVGTLMGGVVAAMFQSPRTNGDGPVLMPTSLTKLVETFLRVDEKIALTKPLKTAARELGLRGRSIALSPAEVRRAVLRGSRDDPGFAATGAPPPLIDALSDLFLIPHADTVQVARTFVAGDITGALDAFGQALKRHTLSRLGVEWAMMGSSLIEQTARELLEIDEHLVSDSRQPYNDPDHPVAFFGTATNLGTESLFWLGDSQHLSGARYDFVKAALASSAFPSVFAPQRESDLYPGVGNRRVRFADGGMFDNLPIIPAIRLLADAQEVGAKRRTDFELIRDRLDYPDLFLVGALNANPEADSNGMALFDDILSIHGRGRQLKNNVKIRGFERFCESVESRLRAAPQPPQGQAHETFLRRVVNAAILPIFPSDEDHINPTFAFCTSMGLDRDRVGRSIANGCYQSLDAFSQNGGSLTGRALAGLREIKRLAVVERAEMANTGRHVCPYFVKRDAGQPNTAPLSPFDCPFAHQPSPSDRIHQLCLKDPVHRRPLKKSFLPLFNG
jgi:predicted acylesterase/phospholipase RssA